MSTEFKQIHNKTGEDVADFATWEGDTDIDYTVASTKVVGHGGVTGTLVPGDNLEKSTDAGVTATIAAITGTQCLLVSIVGVINSGDKMQKVAATSNHFTTNTAVDAAQAVLDCRTDDGEVDDQIDLAGATSTDGDLSTYRKVTGRNNKQDMKYYNNSGFQILQTTINSSAFSHTGGSSDKTIIEWVQHKLSTGNGGGLGQNQGGSGSSRLIVRNCLTCNDEDHGGAESGIVISNGGSYASNNVIYGPDYDNGVKVLNGGDAYNNTVIGTKIGFDNGGGAGDEDVRNNRALACTNENWDSGGGFGAASSHNLGESGDTIPGGSSQTSTLAAELSALATGTHDGAGNAATLSDSGGDFINDGVKVDMVVFNETDGSAAFITAVTATTITGVLVGGTDNDWDASDAYRVIGDFSTTKAGGNSIDNGVDLGTTPENVNLSGNNIDRDVTGAIWDIGDFEIAAAAGGGPIIVNANLNGGKLNLSGGKL